MKKKTFSEKGSAFKVGVTQQSTIYYTVIQST